MSTRKTTASAAAKVENATTTTTTTAKPTTTEKAAIGVEKTEMGAKASTAGENSCNETEIAATTTTNKDALKVETSSKMDTKPIANEPKRITRNSPLFLLASPPNASTAAAGLRKEPQQPLGEPADSEPTNSESEDGGSVSGGKRSTQIRGRKSLKEAKEAKEAKEEPKEVEKKDKDAEVVPTVEKESKDKEIKVVKEVKETKETKEAKDTKDAKEKDAKEVKEVSVLSPASSTASTTSGTIATTTTNRLTRKSVAQELVTNTRITRNRQTSTGRPETPPTAPTRSRRGAGARKMPLPMAEPASKRKRSVEESAAVNAEPGAKYIKIEVKDDSEATEDDLMLPASAGSDLEGLRIKHELIESDESAAEAVGSAAMTAASTTTATAGRGRGRWGPRKPQANPQVSPSTRATRQSKVASPSPSASSVTSEPKRRRTTCRSASTVTRSSSVSLLKTASATSSSSQVHDEDSKDSMASSMDDLVLADIKMEKFTPELLEEEGVDFEMDDKTSTTATEEKEAEPEPEIQPANGISEPLTVDTETMAVTSVNSAATADAFVTPEASTSAAASNSSVGGSEKAASLSPEMVSEGVSEISVKQFYKKPKFLENNLGIEEDPKLGEIVQKVSTEKEQQDDVKVPEEEKETPAKEEVVTEMDKDTTAVEDEAKLLDDDNSVQEGELHLDESTDEKKSSTNDDSLSTGLLSPLVVDEEEEGEEDEVIVLAAATEAAADKELVDSDDVQKVVAEEEDIEEDDLTVEESETISMDNNPSLPEDAPEEREDIDEVEELEKDTETADKELNEKTKNECDNEKAKLEVESEKKEDVKLITTADDQKKPLIDVEQIEEKAVILVIEEKEHKVDIDMKSELDLKVPKSEVVTVTKIEEKIERLEDDDVLAKINAELKKFGEKLEEKSDDGKPPIDAGDDVSTEVSIKKIEKAPPAEAMEVDEEKPVKDDRSVVEKIADILHTEDIIEKETDKMETDTTSKRIDSTDSSKPPTPASSTNTSPTKPGSNSSLHHKDDDTTSMKSGQSTDTNSWVSLDLEYDEESRRQKEQHLQNLGLLTHKAAEKRRLEYIQSSAAAVEASRVSQQSNKRNGKATNAAAHEYTGTLKTVIKLNRSSSNSAPGTSSNGRKGQGQHSKDAGGGVRRQSLKMTFQKGRARGQGNADRTSDQHAHSEEAYYTIQNENEGAQRSSTSGTSEHSNVHTHGRKSYNRSNNTSHSTNTTNSAIIDSSHSEGHDVHTIATNKKDEKEVLIPEKASSFKFHPGRLCEDQCFYCSGKFGLYDTPCHVGQIKSSERQQKILANEEKLTVDNCLCDACFRHVDRRANVPSYKKRLSAPGHLEMATAASCSSSSGGGASASNLADAHSGAHEQECLVPDCPNPAAHSLRRKCIRKSVKKFLLNFEMPAGSACVWLCQSHYDTVIQCSGCVLCKRRLGKNHMYHITSDTDRLEKALSEMGIPVQLGIGTAVCKLCRYFANLLMKPPDSTKSQKAEFVKNYRKRLLQFHNIHDGSNDASEADEDDSNGAITISRQTDSNNTPQKKDKGGSADMTPSKELPSPTGSTGSSVECLGDASAAVVTVEQQQQMLLDNDVLVDYDVPMISTDSNSSSSPTPPSGADKQMSKLKAILQSASTESSSGSKSSSSSADISNALRANPNISMRELFPGEEDLGLQFKAPFGSSTSQRTPEGWTRVQTFLQYDEPTRRLWEELQKPYGNQSSFLRHLILLEKYYRNGDLVLSPNASSNASVYTQTVRQRLSSYDHGHCGGLQSAKPKTAPTADASKLDVPTVEINEDDDDDDENDDAAERRRMDADNAAETVSILRKQLRSRSVSVDKLTKHLSSNAVTITTRPKDPPKPTDISPQKSLLKEKETPQTSSSANTAANLAAANAAAAAALASANGNGAGSSSSNSRSILKTNLLGMNKSVEILPISNTGSSNKSASYSGSANPLSTSTATESKQQKILDVANKLLGNQLEAAAAAAANSANKTAAGASLLTSPPELVSLQRRSSVNGPPVPAVTIAATITATTSNPTNSTTAALINAKRPHMMPKATLNRPTPPNVVILPDTLTQAERHESKSWRPTLMPVEENQHMLNKGGPLYQTADGRRLPALVQVQSGGKPFLISIFDYNRMCILRREKLLRDRMLKDTKNRHEQKQQQQMQKNAAAAAAATAVNLQNFNKLPANTATSKQQQQTAQHQLLQLQLMQLQKHQQLQHHQQHQQQQHQAALKAAAQGRYQPIAPKPIITGSNMSAATSVANSYNAPMMPLLANAITSAASAAASNSNAAAASLNNASWLWNNFPDANQLLMNGSQPGGNKLPQLLHKPTMNSSVATATITSKQQQQQQQHHHHHHQQMLLDNTLMSKIPKSLTVIPQHKLMNTSAAGHNSSGNSGAAGGSGRRE